MSAYPLLPRGIPDPGPPPVNQKTMTRWAQFLGALAAGEGLPESKLKHYITNADIEACTRLDPLELQRYKEAVLAGRKRKFSIMQFQEFFGELAGGKTLEAAQRAVWGTYDPRLNELLIEDTDLNIMFQRALEARALVVMDDIFEVTDDRSRDTLPGPKGGEIPNNAAVNRDKLMAETRLRVAGLYNRKLYGEAKNAQVNVQIINHAETLEAARDRALKRENRVPAITREVIDAAFSEKTADTDTSWMDEKPTDPVWREET